MFRTLRDYPVTLSTALCAVALFVVWLTPEGSRVSAQSSTVQVMEAFAYESLTVTSAAAVGFTSATIVPTNAPSVKAAECTTETASIRYRYDGTNPTTTEGHVRAQDSTFTIYGVNNVRRWRAIASSSTATIKCTYLR